MLILAVVFTRIIIESRRCYDLGQAAQAKGDVNGAILHFRHALEWYAPIGSASNAALRELMSIGDERSGAGDINSALFSYRSARIGIMATRHLWVPYRDKIPKLNQRIAHLMSVQALSDSKKGKSYASRYAKQLNAYKKRRPSPWRGFSAGLILLGWLCSLAVIVVKGFDKQGRPLITLRFLVPLSLLLLVAWLVLVRCA